MADLSRNILRTYVSKVFINSNTRNDDVVQITTQKFSPEGDVYELDRRTISPSMLQTEASLEELEPEVSNTFPFKIVPPEDVDGSVILLSPTADTEVTASQNYYVPIYFERYNLEVLRQVDKDFNELSTPVGTEEFTGSPFGDEE
jgi:hypothetical protein